MDSDVNTLFDGKTVSFGTANETLAMKNISFKEMRNKLFVIGETPSGATVNDLAINRTCAISWDSVNDFIIFENEQEYSNWVEGSE